VGASNSTFVRHTTLRSWSPVSEQPPAGPFRASFAIDVTALEGHPTALRRAVGVAMRELLTRGTAIAFERNGAMLTIRRFDARASFHLQNETVAEYPLAFGLALRDTVTRMVGMDPAEFHNIAVTSTEGSLRHVAPLLTGDFGVCMTRVRAGIATARQPGRPVRRALVIRPLPCTS
jgi:hypothetical protein